MNYSKPERPFLLISADQNDEITCTWSEIEEDLRQIAKELMSYGDKILYAMEIQLCRNIKINESE